MTDYVEEQNMEVEALESIYMEDFTLISQEPLHYKVYLVPNPGSDSDNHVAINLECVIPPEYPDTVPQLEIAIEKGLSQSQKQEMKDLLDENIQDSLGMVMIFTLCEVLKEYLLENNQESGGDSEYQEMLRRAQKQEKHEILEAEKVSKTIDEDAPRKITGTPVTPESFFEWRDQFEAEMREKAGVVETTTTKTKLTGKQIWMQGTDELMDDEEESDSENDDELTNGVDESAGPADSALRRAQEMAKLKISN